MIVVWVALGVVGVVGLATASSFNRFARQRNLIRESWADVDTELKRRHDLVPNLVATVQGYAAHEQSTFDAVIQARAGAVSGGADQEGALSGALRSLLAVAEAYPELKASAHFLDLQHQLVATEDRIQASRRLFNANVRDYDRRVDSLPSLLVARGFGFKREPYFELDSSVANVVPSASFS